MKITGLQCTNCGDKIYSRARHDMRYCSCCKTFVDGGFDYMRVGYTDITKVPKMVHLNIKVNEKILYKDWNEEVDKYGLIKARNKKN